MLLPILPDHRPFLDIDLVGPIIGVYGVQIWCTPKFHWEFQVEDRSGVEAVWGSYWVGPTKFPVTFTPGATDGWWGASKPGDARGYSDLRIYARDSLGNVSNIKVGSQCAS